MAVLGESPTPPPPGSGGRVVDERGVSVAGVLPPMKGVPMADPEISHDPFIFTSPPLLLILRDGMLLSPDLEFAATAAVYDILGCADLFPIPIIDLIDS